jgi:hypothetical protein
VGDRRRGLGVRLGSLIERDIEQEILPFALDQRIGVIVYSPMGSGMLTGKMTRARIEQMYDSDWRKHDERFQEPRLSQNLDLVDRLTAIAERYNTTHGYRRGRLDTASPRRRRRHRRLPAPRPGRPHPTRFPPAAGSAPRLKVNGLVVPALSFLSISAIRL